MKKLYILQFFLLLFSYQQSAVAQYDNEDYYGQNASALFLKLGLQSDRVFRGQNLYNGTSLQPQLKAGYDTGYGIVFGDFFSHLPADNNNSEAGVEKSFSELNYSLGYMYRYSSLQFNLGYRWYDYSRTTQRLRDTSEVYGGVDTAVVAHPHFYFAYDNDEFSGWYYEAGLEQPIPLIENSNQVTALPYVNLGISSGLDNGNNRIYDDSGITHLEIGLKTIMPITPEISFQPEIKYVQGIDDAATSDFVFGINLVGDFTSIAGFAKFK